MRVGVYTIALNEAKFVQRWVDSIKDVDFALVADTGSTDGTIDLLLKNDVEVQSIVVKPWRFDDARNAALAMMPADLDIVISLDMDEVLSANWREHLEAAWKPGTTRLRYGYVWSWKDGKPDVMFLSDKIAGRFTHRWKCPVHETLTPTVPETMNVCMPVIIEHHPDSTKPRSQYLRLLELSVTEDPHDDRNSHYLGREYFFHGQWYQAIQEFERHLSLPRATWKAERAASMRYIAKCCQQLGVPNDAHHWFVRATLEEPSSREALIDLAQFELAQQMYHAVIAHCQQALLLPTYTGDYMAERYARAEGAYDLMAVAHWNLGDKEQAIRYAKDAALMNPNDVRLQDNLAKMIGPAA